MSISARKRWAKMAEHSYIACDLGAESGRIILGTLNDGHLALEEMHRFPNGPISTVSKHGGAMHWDIDQIWRELKLGLARVTAHLQAAGGEDISSLSVDSWGVDYVLMRSGHTVARPYHYRDTRTESAYAAIQETGMGDEIFSETGIQFMPINTLYQLLAHRQYQPEQLAEADQFLLIADYFNAQFSGVGVAERSLASTTQLYNPVTEQWSEKLLSRFGLPDTLFPPLADPGAVLGPLLPEIADETGLRGVQVIATCSHDTAAAVAAVPAEGNGWAYLSSGTWSLLGVELPRPLINADVQAAGFTNEIGWGGTTRFLKNIAGLWIVQECRRAWLGEGQDFSYDALTQMAAEAPPFRSLIRPDDARFLTSGEMPAKVQNFCRETSQTIPETPGQIVRCALESLALSYRQTLEQIETLTGRTIRRLHIVGGGSQNALLDQFAAEATGKTVQAGPAEATAIGNLLLQAVTLGHLGSLAELRRTARASFPVQTFEPKDAGDWEEPYARFGQLER
jgi:rhamnulokinase